MDINNKYDTAIIGGGIAGLATSILLRRKGHSVVLFEKEKYPFHKVCGEYVSMESWNFLESLGLRLNEMALPIIDTLFLTSPSEKSFTTKLPLGGFGISRYVLDNSLAEIAKRNGAYLLQETKVNDVQFEDEFLISFSSRSTEKGNLKAKVCCAAFGKRSNLDVKWKRSFLQDQNKKLINYVGIKYHIQTDWKSNVIGLHNFKNGYCGISKIENEKYCLCYMTKAENLKSCDNDVIKMERTILSKNPHLEKIFTEAEVMQNFPVTISQINFNKKSQVENGILMLGDAAGMITPLCGNGMSIALHTAKIAAELIDQFLKEKISQQELEKYYEQEWKKSFSRRLQTGRTLQKFFGNNWLSNLFVNSFKTFPFLAKPLIKLTHGKPF